MTPTKPPAKPVRPRSRDEGGNNRMTTANISRLVTPVRTELVSVRVMAVVDGYAMVHDIRHQSYPFVVYECDLKDVKEVPENASKLSDAMIKSGNEG